MSILQSASSVIIEEDPLCLDLDLNEPGSATKNADAGGDPNAPPMIVDAAGNAWPFMYTTSTTRVSISKPTALKPHVN